MFWADKEDAVELYYAFRWATRTTFEDWLDRLVMMGTIEEKDWHRENGKIFNIPKCCIDWFIHLSCVVKVKNPLTATDKMYGKDLNRPWYVRCPKCRKGE